MKVKGWWIVAIVVVGIYIISMIYAPAQIDWIPSYSSKHSKPLGCMILHEQMGKSFPNKKTYDLWENYDPFLKDTTKTSLFNIIIIDESVNMNDSKLNLLKNKVEAGCNVLISAKNISENISELLGIKQHIDTTLFLTHSDTISLSIANKKYIFNKAIDNQSFNVNNDSTIILSTINDSLPIFVAKKVGAGSIFYHCKPMVFTNYHLVDQSNYKYAFDCLAELSILPTYWDEYSKAINSTSFSPITYIIVNPMVKKAWYLLWAVLIIHTLLELRRRQRIIPEPAIYNNQSLSFVKNLGRLYFMRKSHRDIAMKQYQLFKDGVRRKYYISLEDNIPEKIIQLSAKSGVPERTITAIVEVGQYAASHNSIGEGQLIKLNKTIEIFNQLSN